MTVYQTKLQLKRTEENDLVNLNPDLERILDQAHVNTGILTIFVAGATGAIIALEYEPGLIKDIPAFLERIIPKKTIYHHHETWHDDNGHSHVRAALLGPSMTIPISNGRMITGTWQQITFMELDTRSRTRVLHITVIGE